MASAIGGGKPDNNTLMAKVAEAVAHVSKQVSDKVTDLMVDRVVERRATAIVAVLDHIEKLETLLKRFDKADHILYDADRKPVTQTYTAERLDLIHKIKERLTKANKAINLGVEGGEREMKDVYDIAKDIKFSDIGGKDKGGGGASGEGSSTESSAG